MKYMGSKARFAKELLPILLEGRTEEQSFVEPFVGGANIISHVSGKRIGADSNEYLIALYKSLQKGRVFPRQIEKNLYSTMRDKYNSGNCDDVALIGWIGFMASANGRFFEGGYSGLSETKIGTTRDYIAESIRNIERQMTLIKDVEFICSDYRTLDIPPRSIVYCDPPYFGTKKYAKQLGSYEEFWNWCLKIAKNNKVFVSEYNAPNEWAEVWSKNVGSSLSSNGKSGGRKQSVERLFVPKFQLH